MVEGVAASTGHERYIVLLIDYGRKATVDSSRIRPIPPSLLGIPALARVCTLAGMYIQVSRSYVELFRWLVL